MAKLVQTNKTECIKVGRNETNYEMVSMHYHYSYEIYYLEKGVRNYFIEDKFFMLKEGDFVLIPPGYIHKTGGDTVTRILIDFKEEFLQKYFSPLSVQLLKNCFSTTLVRPSDNASQNFKKLLYKILDEYKKPDTGFAYVYIAELLNELNNCEKCEYIDNSINQKIKTIIEYIDENYRTINEIEEIADQIYVTKYHLCRLFKKETGISLVTYLNKIKLKHACNLMIETDMTITDICYCCGFNSPAYFTNVFKKYMSMTPAEYRKKYT